MSKHFWSIFKRIGDFQIKEMYETLVELTIDRKTKNNIDYKQK